MKKERKRTFIPDGMLDCIYDVTPELLASMNIRGLVCDIDNTLVPYHVEAADERLTEHLKAIEATGVVVAFVSNNKRKRVRKFNKKFKYYAVWDSGKPFGQGLAKCIRHLNMPKENILVVGDQIYTDCLGAHWCGVKCFIVPPIEAKESIFFKLKRLCEMPIISLYRRNTLKR